MLTKHADGIWTSHDPSFSFLGLRLGTRMTVIRTSTGKLWIVSAIRNRDGLYEAIQELGEVEAVIVPNKFHTLFGGACAQYFGVKVYAADITKPINNWDNDLLPLSDLKDPNIDQIPVGSNPTLKETLFFHRSSSTLIATDLFWNVTPQYGFKERLYARLNSVYCRLNSPGLVRMTTKDKAAFQATKHKLTSLDIERVILCHGDICDAKTAIEKALV